MQRQSLIPVLVGIVGISVTSIVAPASAYADPVHPAEPTDPPGAWRAFSTSGVSFVLPSDGSRKILLMASAGGRGPLISLLDLEGPICTSDSASKGDKPAAFSVNGKALGFVEACLNGTAVERPQTDQGEAYLRAIVASGNALTVEDGRGAALHYPAADFRPVKQELQLRAYGF